METSFSQMVEDYAGIAVYVDDLEKQLSSVKEARDNLKAALLAKMNDPALNLDSAKSAAGHRIAKVTNSIAKVVDADAFKDFLAKSGEMDLVQNRASAEACKEYAERTGVAPPGVELGSILTLRFTRAK